MGNSVSQIHAEALPADFLSIYQSKAFRSLRNARRGVAVGLTAAMCVIYFGFILMIAFKPSIVGLKITHSTTLGIPLSFVVYLFVGTFDVDIRVAGQLTIRPHDGRSDQSSQMKATRHIVGLLAVVASAQAHAIAVEGDGKMQAFNGTAVVMFLGFVAVTLGITGWAARRTGSRADFYAAGGQITGFQNGLALSLATTCRLLPSWASLH